MGNWVVRMFVDYLQISISDSCKEFFSTHKLLSLLLKTLMLEVNKFQQSSSTFEAGSSLRLKIRQQLY